MIITFSLTFFCWPTSLKISEIRFTNSIVSASQLYNLPLTRVGVGLKIYECQTKPHN